MISSLKNDESMTPGNPTKGIAVAGAISIAKVCFRLLLCTTRSITVVLTLVFLTMAFTGEAKSSDMSTGTEPTATVRRTQLVEANIIAVQAYQMILSRQAGDAPSTCYPGTPKMAVLQNLVKHQASLLAEPAEQVVEWADSKQSTFDPAKDLQPLLHAGISLSPELPVNVFTQYLQVKAPTEPPDNIRSVANLYQTVLELERDGTVLQDMYRFYIALKLPVYVGQLGLPGSDADFLAAARDLYGKSCASPVDLSVPAWQIAGRKIWNWGEKNLHIKDANTMATELLADPQVVPLIPAMKVLVCLPLVPSRILPASPATPTLAISILLLPLVRAEPAETPKATLALPVTPQTPSINKAANMHMTLVDRLRRSTKVPVAFSIVPISTRAMLRRVGAAT